MWLIGIGINVKIEKETGVRQQKGSRIREETTDRKIKKRRESIGEGRKLALCLSSHCCCLAIVIVFLPSSLSSLLSSSVSAQTAHQELLRHHADGHTPGGMRGHELPS